MASDAPQQNIPQRAGNSTQHAANNGRLSVQAKENSQTVRPLTASRDLDRMSQLRKNQNNARLNNVASMDEKTRGLGNTDDAKKQIQERLNRMGASPLTRPSGAGGSRPIHDPNRTMSPLTAKKDFDRMKQQRGEANNARLNNAVSSLSNPPPHPEKDEDRAEKKMLHAAGTAAKTAGTGAQAAGVGMQAAGKTAQVAGAGVEAAGKGVQAVGKGLQSAGKAMGAIPVVGTILGGITAGAGAAAQGAGKATEAAGKGVKTAGKGVDKAGQATKKAGGEMKKLGNNARAFEKELPQKKPIGQGGDMARLSELKKNRMNDGRQQAMIQGGMNANGANKSPLMNQKPGKKEGEKERSEEEEEEDEEEEENDERTEQQRSSLMQKALVALKLREAAENNFNVQKANEMSMDQNAASGMIQKIIDTAAKGEPITFWIWCNIKMIYGGLLRKGKDDFIPDFKIKFVPKYLGYIILAMIDLIVIFIVTTLLILIAIILYAIFNPCWAIKYFEIGGWIASKVCGVIS